MNLRDIIREAERQGFRVSLHGSHYHAVPPDKRKPMVVFSLNTGSWRAIKNVLADLRRAGLRWTPHALPKERKMNPAAIDKYIKENSDVVDKYIKEHSDVVVGHAPKAFPSAAALEAGVTLEQRFAELKDARVLVAMADEEFTQALKALKEAEARRDAAGKSLNAARAELRQAKERFDAECD